MRPPELKVTTRETFVRVVGVPAPQGSKRAFVQRGRAIMVENSAKVKPWRSAVASAALDAVAECPMLSNGDACYRLTVRFDMPRPRAHYRKNGALRDDAPNYCNKRPDLDKLLRSTKDSLTGIVWHDDSQVVCVFATKVYADGHPGASIVIERMERGA